MFSLLGVVMIIRHWLRREREHDWCFQSAPGEITICLQHHTCYKRTLKKTYAIIQRGDLHIVCFTAYYSEGYRLCKGRGEKLNKWHMERMNFRRAVYKLKTASGQKIKTENVSERHKLLIPNHNLLKANKNMLKCRRTLNDISLMVKYLLLHT